MKPMKFGIEQGRSFRNIDINSWICMSDRKYANTSRQAKESSK